MLLIHPFDDWALALSWVVFSDLKILVHVSWPIGRLA